MVMEEPLASKYPVVPSSHIHKEEQTAVARIPMDRLQDTQEDHRLLGRQRRRRPLEAAVTASVGVLSS
jgi:hypothetical protein